MSTICSRVLPVRVRLVAAFVFLAPAVLVAAEHPDAAHLLPENTVLYVRFPNTAETVAKFKETAIGRITQDPAMKPLVSQLYGSAIEAFQRAEEQIGASLDDLLSIPTGEMCLAIVAPEESSPAIVFLVNVGDRMQIVEKVLGRISQGIEDSGSKKSEESLDEVKITIFDRPGDEPGEIVFAVRDSVILVASNLAVAKGMLNVWSGKKAEAGRLLADNPDFAAIMRRCSGTDDQPPQVEFFIDPITLFSRATRGNTVRKPCSPCFPPWA